MKEMLRMQVKWKIINFGVYTPENSFILKSSRLWNSLSVKLCLTSNMDSFKSVLKNIIYVGGYQEPCDVIIVLFL